jgi:cell division septum initiation protein DivIVA
MTSMEQRLGPHQVSNAVFAPASRRRGGVDGDEVREFLQLVATEVARLQWEVGAAQAENDRIKAALYAWQSAHAATCPQHREIVGGGR